MFNRHIEVFLDHESDEIVIRQYDEKGYLGYIKIPISQAEEVSLTIDSIRLEEENREAQ